MADRELMDMLRSIQNKLHADNVADSLARIDTNVARLLEADSDKERRLRKVENRLHWYSGASAVVGGIFAVIGDRLFHN